MKQPNYQEAIEAILLIAFVALAYYILVIY
jgi:hypothetical protein